MTAAPASKATYTADDLLAMEDAVRYELDDGELVERPVSMKSSRIGFKTCFRFESFARQNGLGYVVGPDLGLQVFRGRPNRIPRADVVYFSRERFTEIPGESGFARLAPDLIVEVVSPGNIAEDMQRKVNEYLSAGVRAVWVAFPNEGQVFVHTAAGVERFDRDDTITGGDVIPGFEAKVADLLRYP